MKKYYVIGAFVAALSMMISCNKDNNVIEESQTVNIIATYEQPEADANTKVAISEGATNFVLNWEGDETLTIANSTNNTYKDDFTISGHSGSSATFTGTLPAVTGETTNYIGVVSVFSSVAGSFVRGEIPGTQSYNGANLGKQVMLFARADNSTVGSLPSLEFKTMNSFLKLTLVKGSAALGSSNSYSSMYVQSIKVESVNEETIAGRYGISKTGDDWDSSYGETVSGFEKTSINLDCTAQNASGEEITSAKDFYIALAFGTYAKGLKVTINVKNESGKDGKFEAYIKKNESLSIGRNKMLRMPSLTVNPEDATVETYTLIENPALVTAGTYYLAAKSATNTYQLATGNIVSNKDLETSTYTYNPSTKVLTGSGAAEVTFVSVAGGFNVKFGSSYLRAKSASNRTLAIDATTAIWSFGVSKNSSNEDRGGMTMIESTYSTCIVSASAASAYLRNYGTATNGSYGVYLFKKDD